MKYPTILYDLTDKTNRNKLINICQSLSKHKLLDLVYLGKYPMSYITELLDATQSKSKGVK